MSFIYRNGSQLYQNNIEYRFVSFNIPNLFILEDPYWHQSTAFEQTDALSSIQDMDGKAVRVYPFSFQKGNDDYPRHFSFSAGKWILNEKLFQDVDRALYIANLTNIRIIIPFIDMWDYWGGIPSFTSRNNLPISDFFTNALLLDQFKLVISTILDRVNTISGVIYKNDPTILAWETGNELDYQGGRLPVEWTLEISKYIKQIDVNHLVIDGSNGDLGWDHSVLIDSNIDIYTNHYYTSMNSKQLAALITLAIIWIILLIFIIKSFFQTAKVTVKHISINSILMILVATGFALSASVLPKLFPDITSRYISDDNLLNSYNKVLLVGELGLHKWTNMDNLISEFIPRRSTCGVLIWSLRFHSESGGFYTHDELQNYKAYHYPGFPEAPGFGKDEEDVLRMIKNSISKLNKFMGYPKTNNLQLIPPVIWNNGSSLYMKGSFGASSYILEYSSSSVDFSTEREFLDNVQSGSLVANLQKQGWYRVIASNYNGASTPSNSLFLKS